MKVHPRLRNIFCLAAAWVLLPAIFQPAPLEAQTCNGLTPAYAVDDAYWIRDVFGDLVFRAGRTNLPLNQIPAERDSTSWASLTVPGFDFGHEIFQSVDVAGDYLFAGYNAGVQAWDISHGIDCPPPPDPTPEQVALCKAELPELLHVVDGWAFGNCASSELCTGFLSFPPPSEEDFLTEDVAALQPVGSTSIFVALSGKNPVGTSLFEFDTTSETLNQIYQDIEHGSRMVRLASYNDGQTNKVYAFASGPEGLYVYDVSRAAAIGPCVDTSSPGAECSGVFKGTLGTVVDGGYLDVLERASGEILVATTNGNSGGLDLELWQVDDPAHPGLDTTDPFDPGTANLLFAGRDNRTYGTALFSLEGTDYLAVIERVGVNNVVEIFDITNCADDPCSLGSPVWNGLTLPGLGSRQFLTFSASNGVPFLHYGINTSFLNGSHTDHLLNLETLGDAVPAIPEITAGGPTYSDTCSGTAVGYWGYSYAGNDFGFGNYSPIIGKFHPDTNYFYRAEKGILNVHVWEAGAGVQQPRIATSITAPTSGPYWIGDDITFDSVGQTGCIPGGEWTWMPDVAMGSQVSANPTTQPDATPITYQFSCDDPVARCSDAEVSVTASNSDASCVGAVMTAADLTVKDPSLTAAVTPASGTFQQGGNIPFQAVLEGRGPVDLTWSLPSGATQNDGPLDGDLSSLAPALQWDTTRVTFTDGFESGDTSRWGSDVIGDFTIWLDVVPSARGAAPLTAAVTVTLTAASSGGGGSGGGGGELLVTEFKLDRQTSSSAGACVVDFNCIQGTCTCYDDQTITFTVSATGGPDFFDFDWDDDGTFEDSAAASGSSFTHVYTQPIGLVQPRIQARKGATQSPAVDLEENLDIQP